MATNKTYIHYRWLGPEGECAGDIAFSCECGHLVKREQVDIYDEIVCECGIRYKFRTEIYVERCASATMLSDIGG